MPAATPLNRPSGEPRAAARQPDSPSPNVDTPAVRGQPSAADWPAPALPRRPHYADRLEAGRILAQHVRACLGAESAIVLALARGGVPVGCELARQLAAPVDVVAVRKLGLPARPELALGAITAGGAEVLDQAAIVELGASRFHVAAVADQALADLRRREALYRRSDAPLDVRERTVILVDDGLATGATMRAAIYATRDRRPRRIIVAVPVGDPQGCARVALEVDALICPVRPDPFYTVALWYRDYRPTSDEEVRRHLNTAAAMSSVEASRSWT